MSDAGRYNRGRSRLHQVQQQLPRRPGRNETTDRNLPEESPSALRVVIRSRETAGTRGSQSVRDATMSRSSSGNVPTSDPVRDEAIAGPSSSSTHSRNESGHVLRPPCLNKTGTDGQLVFMKSNYFELIQKMGMHLLHYHVDFKPEIEHSWVKCGLLGQHQQLLGKYLFDGSSLFNVKRLSQPLELTSTRNLDGTAVVMTVKLVGEIQKEDNEYLKVMNIIFRRCLTMLNLVLMNRNYFDPAAEKKVQGITIWPGYRTTIGRRENNQHLLLVEVVHKFLRQDTAFDIIARYRRPSSEPFNDLEMSRVKAELVGKIVMTVYNRKTYRVDDVDFETTPSSTFHHRKEDRFVTYIEFYRTQYQLDIKDLTQPLLVTRPSRRDVNRGDIKPIYLIPELCGMTGLSDDQRKDFTTMRQVSKITRVGPDRRVQTLLNFRQRLERTPAIQTELSSWGIQFSNDLVSCKGRALPAKTIFVGGQHTRVSVTDGDWSRNMHNKKMAVSVEMKHWIVLYPENLNNQVRSFVQQMRTVGDPQGFEIPAPDYFPLDADRLDNYTRELTDKLSRKDYDMVMCVLQNSRADMYNSIKMITLSNYGIPSQVVTQRIILEKDRKLKSIVTKVMTQIACKLGAEPWRVDLPNKPWMIVGYDTYHDARQQRAVGAFVASVNSSYTRFYSSVKRHEANEDISNNFKDYTFCSLKAYFKENGHKLPENIIVYRDGVGVGDFKQVSEVEIEAIKSACEAARKEINMTDWNPGIAYIIVTKRISTRFFTSSPTPNNNPKCGTVVDNVVTHSDRFNFYLVSQKVNQGTVSPTMYDVIYDSTRLTPDIHQSLAYALTHLYYNWAGTLRIPAPIQYAHKLAYLVGENMGDRLPHENLVTFPYYL